jgi:hypothetical protein
MATIDGLSSYWKLDESSGDASDATANVRTLTNNGTTTYAAAKINNGADFGTTNSTKYLTRTGYVVSDGACSFSFWVKQRTEIASGVQAFIDLVSQSTSLTVTYEYNAGTRRIRLSRGRNNLAYAYADYTVTLGTANFYHVVCVYDETNILLYVNGALITSTAASGNGTTAWTPGGGFFSIGVSRDANDGTVSQYASAYIDEVGIWSKALTAAEVTALYAAGAGLAYPFPDAVTMTAEVGSFLLTPLSVTAFKGELSNTAKPTTSITNINKP